MKLSKQIISKIIGRRKYLQISAGRLAEQALVHRNTVSRLESDGIISLESLWGICNVLGFTIDSLFEKTKPVNENQLKFDWSQKSEYLVPSSPNRGSDVLRPMQARLGSIGPGASGMRKAPKFVPGSRADSDGERTESMLILQSRIARLRNSVLQRVS